MGTNNLVIRASWNEDSRGTVDCQHAGPRNDPNWGAGRRGSTAQSSGDTAATTIEERIFLFYFGHSFLIGNVVAGSGLLIHDTPLRVTTSSRCYFGNYRFHDNKEAELNAARAAARSPQ